MKAAAARTARLARRQLIAAVQRRRDVAALRRQVPRPRVPLGVADRGGVSHGPHIGVVTVAPWHDSLGDVATERATIDHLGGRGVPTRQVLPSASPAGPGPSPAALVVGGGDLLTCPSDPVWRSALDRYCIPGRHLLNAVGLDPDRVLDRDRYAHLADYRLLSCRDEPGAEFIAEVTGRDVSLVPCPATLVAPAEFAVLGQLPGYEEVGRLRPGGFAVVHRHPAMEVAVAALRSQMPVVTVDMQRWRRYPLIGEDVALPSHDPCVAMALVAEAAVVVTISLHLAIFAIGSGTPLAVLDQGDPQGKKVKRYLERAGAGVVVTHDRRELFGVADAHAALVKDVGAAERERARAHLAAIVSASREALGEAEGAGHGGAP